MGTMIVAVLSMVCILTNAISLDPNVVEQPAVADNDTQIDIIPLLPYEPYSIKRLRFEEINQVMGYEASGKMLQFKTVSTMLGEVEVPHESKEGFEKLSAMERSAILSDRNSEFNAERDVAIAFEMIHNENDVEAAISLLHDVAKDVRIEFGEEHPMYANAMADLGYAYMIQNRFNESHDHLVQAMKIDEVAQDKLGVHNLAASINLMATSALKSKRAKFEAISIIYEKAFNGLSKVENPAKTKVLINLANMYRMRWLPVRSIGMLKLAKGFITSQHANKNQINDPMYYDVSLYLGSAYLVKGDLVNSLELLKVAQSGYETLGFHRKSYQNYIECLYQKGMAHLMLHDFEQSFIALKKARKSYTQSKHKTPQGEMLLLIAIAESLLGLQKYDQATIILEAVKQIPIESDNEMKYYLLAKTEHVLAIVYDQTKDLDEQLAQHKIAYDMSMKVFGPEHEFTKKHAQSISQK